MCFKKYRTSVCTCARRVYAIYIYVGTYTPLSIPQKIEKACKQIVFGLMILRDVEFKSFVKICPIDLVENNILRKNSFEYGSK